MQEMRSRMQEKERGVQKQIEWRRAKVMELSSQGYNQVEISRRLQITESTISRDIEYVRQQSRQKIGKYIDETLPEEYEKSLVGINSILKEVWDTSQNTENKKEKIQALSLAKECYSMKLDLLTNATVVNDAMRFVEQHSTSKHQISHQKEGEEIGEGHRITNKVF
jgi:hypothetical protein